jgi:DNA-binding NtrC family response regulator
MSKQRILIVEDERTALRALKMILEDEGYAVLESSTGEDGPRIVLSEQPDLVLLDIRLPDLDGISVLQRLRAAGSNAAVIIMTAETSSANAIRATQYGAFDYLSKPIHDEHLLLLIRRALEYRQLETEVRSLRAPAASLEAGIPGMVGHAPAMQEVYKTIGRVSDSAPTVLVSGESGTGKELVANALHEFSGRRARPLVKVNCAAIPADLLEAELFGHEKGAFTNAVSRRIGRFEQAQEGTLFLDEVGDLPLALQVKLLRAIQERTAERVGGYGPIPVDFRLVAATALDLSAAVAEGRFREDLYYRLNVVAIALPPLRRPAGGHPTSRSTFPGSLPKAGVDPAGRAR